MGTAATMAREVPVVPAVRSRRRPAWRPTAPLGALIGRVGPNGRPFLIGAR
jgi:hypothetical protein